MLRIMPQVEGLLEVVQESNVEPGRNENEDYVCILKQKLSVV